ncbi:RluA family pseudouridine synthase [Oscillospiraceae bacterium Marseille-Q3528]|nr:RluA family pseudouridine synthase [Oscillospiraceae bacterium Marseille-Q3528]
MTAYTLTTELCDEGLRLDRFLSEELEDHSRSFLQKLIKEGLVTVDGKPVKANYRLSAGQQVSVQVREPEEVNIEPQEMPLDILYEDGDVCIVNKPKGMVVHPAAGHYRDTLVNGIMYHCQDSLSGINGSLRPGIVHRIDKDTTGALIICKNDKAHSCIAEQLKEHSITRRYRAIIIGNLSEDEGTVDAPIGRHPTQRKKMAVNRNNGKRAVTHYRVLARFRGYTYIECRLETGRTHQIRVHMASIGHPLLGDTVYGPAKQAYPSLEGQTLHAMVIGFVHPTTGAYMEFEAPLPAYFAELLQKLPKI